MAVTLKPEFRDKVSEDDLKQFMKRLADAGKLPKYAVPDRYVFMDQLPKTSVGKLNKLQLRQRYPK
jgi:fatty-acyl-CoA synthase